jgi:hypothetical protein
MCNCQMLLRWLYIQMMRWMGCVWSIHGVINEKMRTKYWSWNFKEKCSVLGLGVDGSKINMVRRCGLNLTFPWWVPVSGFHEEGSELLASLKTHFLDQLSNLFKKCTHIQKYKNLHCNTKIYIVTFINLFGLLLMDNPTIRSTILVFW